MKDLSQYPRRRPIESRLAAPQKPATEPEGYVAFNAKDQAMRLQIRLANDSTYSLHYMLLPPIVFDGEYGTNFVIMFGNITVRARGRNLQTLISAIEMGMAEFIQQYDPERWPKPPNSNEPIIEWMEIEAHDLSSLLGQSAPGKSGGKAH